jgi:short-subunit dehydrogenase
MSTAPVSQQPTSITSRVIVVTGASSGIGRATALAFSRQGAKLVLCSRDKVSLAKVEAECRLYGANAHSEVGDVANLEDVKRVKDRAIDTYGRMDGWVNCAAVLSFGRFEDIPIDIFRRVIETNLMGCVNGSKVALTQFGLQGDRGILINVGSLLGIIAEPYASAYVATKFAIRGLTASLRQEARNRPHLHICAVLPWAIDTPIYQKAANVFGRKPRSIFPVYASERVAEAIVGLMDRPRAELVVGSVGHLYKIASQIVPLFLERLIGRVAPGLQFQEQPTPSTDGNVFAAAEPHSCDGGWKRYWRARF